jgi:hypothetical protein
MFELVSLIGIFAILVLGVVVVIGEYINGKQD